MTDDEDVPETMRTYFRLRGLPITGRRGRRRRVDPDDEHAPFSAGRDPRGLDDVLSALTAEAGWNPQLAREDLVAQWADVAGEGTAQHSRPVGLIDGVLSIQCDSTAWAKQLHLMRAAILTEILRRFPEAGVESVRFLGPDVPSWKWGPRTIPGRGPRDTYG